MFNIITLIGIMLIYNEVSETTNMWFMTFAIICCALAAVKIAISLYTKKTAIEMYKCAINENAGDNEVLVPLLLTLIYIKTCGISLNEAIKMGEELAGVKK